MSFVRTRRIAVVVVASCMAAAPAAASVTVDPIQGTDRTDAAQSGQDTKSVFPPPGVALSERAAATGADRAFPPAGYGGGDRAYDHPGMSRASTVTPPSTIEVVRPERTIVRDVDEALPIVLSSAALMLVLAGFGVLLVRGRPTPRLRGH